MTADPGAVFASDAHRRVLAHLPLPDEDPAHFDAVLARLDADAPTPVQLAAPESHEALATILSELVADGDADQADDRYRISVAGFDRLNGPNGNEPPPLEGARLKAAEALDAELETEDEAIAAEAAHDRVERAKAELVEAEEALAGGTK